MGEIGIPRREYLYELTLCDLLMIERGYHRRSIDAWSTSRWSTYHIMAAFVGGDELRKQGLYSPKDLLPLPWDRTPKTEQYSEEDIKGLQSDIDAANQAGISWI